jgi:amino acid adenylation domain-containing protein/non-ribosomal peptide synthase protein (TIGR01720 family)
MNAQDALKLARRFIELPLQKRQLFLDGLRREGVDFSLFPIPHGVPADDRDALSYAQQRMWFLWQLDPQSAAYNLPGAVRLRGQLDVAACEHAFASLIERHETLRTVFRRQADDSLRRVPCTVPLTIEREDFSSLPVDEREARVLDQARQQAMQPFDLGRGPLLRVRLLKLAAQEHVLLLTLHHIVSDGWSMNVLIDEFTRFYDAHQQGAVALLAPLAIQYSDYALWQRRWLEAGEQARQLDYWRAQLGDEHPPLELPLDHPRPAMASYRGVRHPFTIDDSLVEQLRSLARQHNVTLFMLLLASFDILLHRYTGQCDIRVGVPIANRNRSEVEGLIGFFVNTQVLRCELDGQLPVADLLQIVRQAALGAQAHQDLPFEQLVEALKLERSLSHTPLFQVMYNHQPQVADLSSIRTASGLTLDVVENQGRSTQFDLTLDTWEQGGRLHAALTYASDLFDAATIERMAQHWTRLLQAMVRDPQQRIGELPMLAQDEYQLLIHDWNRSAGPRPDSRCIHQMIAEQADIQPDHLALIHGTQQVSYRQLDSRANQLAHHLIELGVGPEVRVGVALSRGSELVIALLAVLKAGGAYVPLDPQYPAERVAYMLQDSQARVLLTQTDIVAALPSTQAQVVLLDQGDWLDSHRALAPLTNVSAHNLAYVIYTSGSTGKPKGVAIAHGNVAALIHWSRQVYSQADLQGVLASTSVCFDLSVWEIFVTLACGGFMVMARNALELPELAARDQVRLVNSVPSAVAGLQRLGQIPDSVRIINLAGEPLKQQLVKDLYGQPGIEHVYDLYGPSEDTTYSTWTRRSVDGTANIGRPLTHTRSYLLDGNLQPVPIGVAAELYLAGAGITRGYLLRPALTAERFVPDPFSSAGERLYRTGDLARYRPDGVIEYVGRIDHQIKLRGFRIELGEIEARLSSHPLIKDAVVLVHEGKTLVGYVVSARAEDDAHQASQTLKNHLLQSLPDYMVPSAFVHLQQLPLTPNGKLDRKALPAPDTLQNVAFSAPVSEREVALAEIWQQVLGLEQVGLDDNFFELGGDSIVSIQVVSRARQQGLNLTPRDLFQFQTLRSLAEVPVPAQAALVNQEIVTGPAPLTPVQAWFFQQPIPQRHHWNQAVLLAARTPVDIAALQLALNWLVQQHDALRLRFNRDVSGWQQWHGEVASVDIWQRQADSDAELRRLCSAAQASLDLEQGPLLRALLVDLADGSQRLLLAIHHLVVDGVSWRILLEDLQQAYRRSEAGQALSIEHKTSAYQHWARRLSDYASSAPLLAELEYWQTQPLQTAAELPCDNPAGRLDHGVARTLNLRLDAQRTRQLLQLAPAAYRTQVNDLLLTALSRVVCRWSGQGSTLIQLEGHGREQLFDDIDLTRTVGWFTSMYPVRLTPADDLADSIKAIKEQLRGVPNRGVGYGVLRYLAAGEPLRDVPQPRITFNYLGQFDQQFDEQALFVPAGEGSGDGQSVQAPLTNWLSIEGRVFGSELVVEWTFSHEMYQEATIQRLLEAYQDELTALVDHCSNVRHRGVTPSDFPLARISQMQLDQLPLPAGQIEAIYPLSPMQQGMLFHSLYEDGAGHYVNQMRLDIDGLDPERFARAWQAAVDAHPILRTGFLWQGGLEQPLQCVLKQVQVPFAGHDWQQRADCSAALDQLARTEQRPFDLQQAGLLRLQLVRTGPARHHFIYTHHHILLDGWSNAQLLGEVLQRYHGQSPANAASSYEDYIAWLQGQDRAASEAFWRQQLTNLTQPTRLATGNSSADDALHQDHCQWLDVEQTRQLSEFARQHKVTVNSVLQAAWLLLLQRYSGHACVCFGATVAGRPAQLPGIEQQIGLFINTLPVVASPRAEQPLSDWLQQVQLINLNLREQEQTPLAEIQRWAQVDSDALFDTLLVFENYPVAAALEQGASQGLSFGEVRNSEQAHYPLTLAVGLSDQLSLHYSYACDHFSCAAIEQIAGHLQTLLQAMVEHPEALLGNLSLLTADAQQGSLEQWNPARRDFPSAATLTQRIEAQAARSPDAVALSFASEQLTYAELNQRANRLAHLLIERGVGPDRRVGLAAERSAEMIIGLLAILKAGGAYVPLDPAYPQERLRFMIEDSGIDLLLAQASVLEQLPLNERVEVLLLDHDTGLFSDQNPQVNIDPANLAYVIYTSGSTGQPKGALLSHDNVLRLFAASGEHFQFGVDDVWTLFHSYAFDFSVWEIFGALLHGGRLVIVPHAVSRSPEDFHALLLEQGVTVLNQTPSAFKSLMAVACASAQKLALRYVIFGGEALDVASLKPWFDRFDEDSPKLINMYGITETTVHVTYRQIRSDDLNNQSSPIGTPLADLSWYLLDGALNPVPKGCIGELYIGGAGLARGYLNRQDLTATRFIPNLFADDGSRLYRTGDLARYGEDGRIDYLGRSDQQVKIRGFRIELGEIEALLLAQPQIRQAVVLARESASGQQLVAYLVTDEAADLEPIRDALKQKLPDYMVPTHLIFIDQLPLTGNGKLDRKALPEPDASLLQGTYLAPQSQLEQQIASIWQDVLKLERVGLGDNFFELGGDSIISIQVVSRARQMGIHFSPKQLFEQQTVQGLASVASTGESAARIEHARASGALPLLPIQRMFFATAIPARHHWNQSVVLKPVSRLDHAVLQQALDAVVAHHDAFRLRFTDQADGWHAAYSDTEQRLDLLWHSRIERLEELQQLGDEAQRSLNLEGGPLLRAVLVDLSGEKDEQRLLLAIHHLLVDGVSWRVLFEDLQSAYRQIQARTPMQLPARTSSIKAWAEQLEHYAVDAQLQEQLPFWRGQTQSDTTPLPGANLHGSQQSRHALTVNSMLDPQLTRRLLQDAPVAYRTQVNDLLLSALSRVIARWTGDDHVLLQLEGHGREELFDHVDLSRTVGWFTSLFPVRLPVAASLADTIKLIKEHLRAIPDKGMGYGVLRYMGSAQVRAELAALPAPQITFNYLGQFDGSFDRDSDALFVPASEPAGLEMSPDAPLGNWLAINGQVFGGELRLGWTFSREVFAETSIRTLAEAFTQELQQLIEHCTEADQGSLTPSDIALARLSQAQIDSLGLPGKEIEDIYPLSPMQQGMLFHSLLEREPLTLSRAGALPRMSGEWVTSSAAGIALSRATSLLQNPLTCRSALARDSGLSATEDSADVPPAWRSELARDSGLSAAEDRADVPPACRSELARDSGLSAAEYRADVPPACRSELARDGGLAFAENVATSPASHYINQIQVGIGGLEVERFRAAWQAAVDSHDILRTGFIADAALEQPLQVVHRNVEVPFCVVDWRQRADQQAALIELAHHEREQGFDLSRPPLLRLRLVQVADDRHLLIYTGHHILMDGWSNSQLLGEVLQRYQGVQPPRHVGRYRDYIAWLQRQDNALAQAFWAHQLAPLAEPTLLGSTMSSADQTPGYGDVHQRFDRAQTLQLSEFARQQKVTVNTLVQAAWLLLLQRYSGQPCVTFGATVAGRPAEIAGIEQQIGLFINTLPVIASPRGEQPVDQWLQTVQGINLALREHEHTPLFDIQRWAGQGGVALFDSLMVFENYPVADVLQHSAPQGLVFDEVTNREQTNYPLTLAVSLGDSLVVHYSFDRQHFAADAVSRLSTHLSTLLLAMIEQPHSPLADLPMLAADDVRQMLARNPQPLDEAPAPPMHRQFEQQASRTPDAVALVFATQQMSYRQLNAHANRLAAQLLARGVGPDVRVALAAERGFAMVVGLLAILKAGGAYLPLDPGYPEDRLAYMLADSGVNLLLTEAPLLGRLPLPAGVETLLIELDSEPAHTWRDANPALRCTAHNLAYVIYTSGSTGKPKGVMVPHGALSNFLTSMSRKPGLSAADRMLSLTTFCFDIFGLEIYLPLTLGACVVLVDKDTTLDPDAILEQVREHAVTAVQATPSTWRMLLDSPQTGALRGCKMLCGGEALADDLALRMAALGPVWNLYGPTETTIWSAQHCLDPQDPRPWLGAAIDNTRLYIVGSDGALLPAGVAGELLIAGDGLARGYFQRAALTAERFLPDPFGAPGQRLYRTGDLARYRQDGVIEYLGRIDQQVKIRGFRIELGEVEARLLDHSDVREAAVLARDIAGSAQLVAYVVAESGASSRDALRASLAQQLSDYMVPTHWLFLSRMPLTPNGKLDRKALPPPDTFVAQERFVEPHSALQQQVAGVWQAVLNVQRVGLADHFFELGGHSLLATQVIARLRQQGLGVSLRDLFDAPLLQDFVERLQEQTPAQPVHPVALVAAGEQALAPLSLAQRRLWVAEQFGAASGAYGMPLALRLDGPLDIGVLRESFAAVMQRHEILRTGYLTDDEGDPIAVVSKSVSLDLPLVDISHLAGAAQQAQIHQAVLDNTRQPIRLEQAPLLRARVLRLSASAHVLLYAMHHIISDGWSMALLANELISHYTRLETGQGPLMSPLPVQYADYARWQLELERQGVLAQQATFWRQALAGSAGLLPLPTDYPRPTTASHAGNNLHFTLAPGLSRALQDLSRQAGVTLYSTLLAAFQVLLHQASGSDDVLIGADVAGRQQAELEGLIGFFVNVLPLRSRFVADDSFRTFAAATQSTALDAFEHQDLPLDMIVEASAVPRHKGANPLLQVLFVMNNLPLQTTATDAIAVQVLPSPGGYSKFDMALFIDQHGEQLQGTWQFASDLFKPERIQQLLDRWLQLLAHIVRDPDCTLRDLDVTTHTLAEQAVSVGRPKADKLGAFLKKPGKATSSATPALFRETPMVPGQPFPLLVEPLDPGLDLIEWVKANRPLLEARLARHAGILFRGFQLNDIHAFEAFAEAVQPGLYGQYGDLPKKEGGKNTYRSTPYPEKKMILFHNESSHQDRWPRKQLFFCEQPSPVGGATPVVDCRLMYQRMPAPLRERFERKGLLYVRTFADKLDVSWQHFFKTCDRTEVQARCDRAGIQWQWLDNDELQIRTPCPAIIRHPLTGEKSFFNQVQLHHIHCLDADVRDDLLALFGEARMPRHVYYGDGSPIENEVMQQLGELYEACAVRFAWQKGDVILLDNMLAAHARDPFEGPRKIVVAMGDMVERSSLADTSTPQMASADTALQGADA